MEGRDDDVRDSRVFAQKRKQRDELIINVVRLMVGYDSRLR